MRNSENVLSSLAVQAEDETYRFEKLIRNLYNPDFYLRAIGKMYVKRGAGTGTIGSASTSIRGFCDKDIAEMIKDIRNETYVPTPLQRAYMPNVNDKKRSLGRLNFKDKLIQEVISSLLEAIYEPIFRDASHGFRPERSCHTALRDVDILFTGTKWFVTADSKGCFDKINHHILLKLLQKRIKDEKFLRLINKFLKSGYMENWVYDKTYSGTPQGETISSILANIYLHELDKFMETLKNGFDKGSSDSKDTPAYARLHSKLYRRRKKYEEEPTKELLQEIKSLEQEIRRSPYDDPKETSYKRLNYVRYADHFIISVIGSKKDAERIKRRIAKFLKGELDLEMSEEKFFVTHVTNRAQFLGYELTVRTPQIEKNEYSRAMRKARNVEFYMPSDYAINWLKKAKVIQFNKDGSWKPVARYSLTNLSDLELLMIHNSEIRGIYNYFKMAKNIHRQMSTLIYGLEFSCLGTMARKRKSSTGKIRTELRRDHGWGVEYSTKNGKAFMYFFNDPILRVKLPYTTDADVDKVFECYEVQRMYTV